MRVSLNAFDCEYARVRVSVRVYKCKQSESACKISREYTNFCECVCMQG